MGGYVTVTCNDAMLPRRGAAKALATHVRISWYGVCATSLHNAIALGGVYSITVHCLLHTIQ